MTRLESFYFLRHGETDANRQGLMCGGEWDIDLNEAGREQCRSAIDAVMAIPDLAGVYVSPLRRAVETAAIATSGTGLKPVVVDELREWCVGEWEGKPWAETANVLEWNHDPPGGETRLEFEKRIGRGRDIVMSKPANRLIVSHGAVWTGLSRLLKFQAPHAKNGMLMLVQKNANGSWTAGQAPAGLARPGIPVALSQPWT
jgi:broad specificity phosphatase PhoE